MTSELRCAIDYSCFIFFNMENLEEIWKDVPGYEGHYQCSNFGNIKSLKTLINVRYKKTTIKEIIMKPSISNGYKGISLSKNGKIEGFKIHQLVAITFLNHKRCNSIKVVDHIDNNKLNNHVSNLQIISTRENSSKNRINKSGFTGVLVCENKYRCYIDINKKRRYLGTFTTKQEASEIYKKSVENLDKFTGDIIEFRKLLNIYKKPTSNQKGVYYSNKDKRWVANHYINKKRIILGYFRKESDAISARLKETENKNYNEIN